MSSLSRVIIQNCTGPIRSRRRALMDIACPIWAGKSPPSPGRIALSSCPSVSGKAATCTSLKFLASPMRKRRLPSAPSRLTFFTTALSGEAFSSTQTLPSRIDEHRHDDARLYQFTLERKGTHDLFSRMRQATLVQPQGNEFLKLRGPSG